MTGGIVDIVAPVFGVLLIGYGAARLRLIDETSTRGLVLFVFNFAIPPLLFRSLALAELPAAVPWGLLLSYYLAVLTVFALGMLGARGFSRKLAEQGLFGFGAAYSNAVLIGVPLILTAFGDAASLPLFLLIACHSPILFTLLIVMIEAGHGSGAGLRQLPGEVVRGLLRNPLIIGLALGLTWNLLALPLPGLVDSVLKTLGQAALPGALFAMGASLSRYRIAGRLPEAVLLVTLKMLVHPLLVWWLATGVFRLPPLWVQVAVLLAALPGGVNVYLFAERYRVAVDTASTTIVLGTAVSLVSLPLVLALLL